MLSAVARLAPQHHRPSDSTLREGWIIMHMVMGLNSSCYLQSLKDAHCGVKFPSRSNSSSYATLP